jgi:TonB-linked SusC/RagA family outer membrane protein
LFTEEELAYGKLRSEHPDQYPAIVINQRSSNGALYAYGAYAYWDNVDWNKVAFRESSPSYTGNVRIARKTDNMHYSVSGGYYKQDGMMNYGNDIFNRYNLRANGAFKVTKWWEIGSNLSFASTEYNSSEAGNDFYFYNLSRASLRSLYNPDGTYAVAGAYIIGLPKDGGRNIQRKNESNLSVNTTIDLIKDVWTVKADANFRFTNGLGSETHYPVYYRDAPDAALKPMYTDTRVGSLTQANWAGRTSSLYTYQVYNVYTDFHKTFAQKHYFQAMVGFNQEAYRGNSSWTRRSDLISTSLPSVELATGTVYTSESINTYALRGAFGRLNYIFDNKYIVEFDGRYDGTSRYPKKDRFGFFPSGSAAWVLSRENFFAGAAEALQIDQLKIRGSYGVLGNQLSSSYYPYIATMGSGILNYPVNGANPLYINQPGVVAGDLTWEKVRTVNGGIELSLLKNRINISFDKYTRYTEGMLVQSKALPNVFGMDPPRTNAGDLKTKGWEVTLGLNNTWQVDGSPLYVGLNFMLSDARSYITKYDNPTRRISTHGNADYYEGQEIGELWGFVTDGYLTKDDLVLGPDGTPTGRTKIDQWDVAEDDNSRLVYEGDLKFKNISQNEVTNDGTQKIGFGDGTVSNPGDRKIIGNTQTRLPYSFDLNSSWKGFDLRAFFQGVGKKDWYPGHNYHAFWGAYGNPWSTPIKENLDHWTPENPDARYPRLKPYIAEGDMELGVPQTKYLQDASYLRLKNLTVGYTLPTSLTDKWNITKLRVYFSAENVFTISHIWVSGVDPEALSNDNNRPTAYGSEANFSGFTSYPFQKVFSFGLNLNF